MSITSGTDLAREFPEAAARVVYKAYALGGDTLNAWDVLVSAHGFTRASQLLRETRQDGEDLGALVAAANLPGYVTPPLPPRPLPTCESPVCEGHLGKFDSCRTEAMWQLSLDQSWPNGETGSSEAYGHYSLFILHNHVHEPLGTGPVISARIVTIPPGNYIVENAESGAVYLLAYDSEQEARDAFAQKEREYAEWEGQEDEGYNGDPEIEAREGQAAYDDQWGI